MGFVITTNSLPPVCEVPRKHSSESETAFRNRQLDHGAIMSRCKLTEVKVSHSNSETFPYTAEQLAVYMFHICEQEERPPEDQSQISSMEERVEYQERFNSIDERVLAGLRREAPVVDEEPSALVD